MNNKMPDPEYLTPREVSAMLKINYATLANWRAQTNKTGVLTGPPYVKLGTIDGQVRYIKQDIHDWVSGSPSAIKVIIEKIQSSPK